ncbi:MAG TPA: chemotaxis response regulator protein-glutamate methylesterase [Opitutaceae bacterium]
MLTRPIRVLVIDDSAVVRRMVSDALSMDPEIEVVGTAVDPYAARDKMRELNPDVLTLDLEMPRMDGITFLKIVMEQHPLPVIIMSSLTKEGSVHALEALRLGAFDVIAKPGGPYTFGKLGARLIESIKNSVGAKLLLKRPAIEAPVAAPRRAEFDHCANPRNVILMGASTGGTEALRDVLTCLPDGLPGIAIVQHIPPIFSKAFADRLNDQCQFEVREAVDGDRLEPGLALLAPGNFHMMLRWQRDHYRVQVTDGPQVWHQRPAVDLLFKSAADCGAGPHALAAIFTGMGKDGAEGLLRLREQGAATFAQDEATSVVYGMPKAAWEIGAAQKRVPLHHAAEYIIQHHENTGRPAPLSPAHLP